MSNNVFALLAAVGILTVSGIGCYLWIKFIGWIGEEL